MNYVGIDPGLHGALVMLTSTGEIAMVAETPVFQVEKPSPKTKSGVSRRFHYDLPAMVELLRQVAKSGAQVLVGLEQVHALPATVTGSVIANFTFGRGLGLWEMGLACFGIPHRLVLPRTWQATTMKGSGAKGKDGLYLVARALWPEQKELTRNSGAVDAALIAEHMRITYKGATPIEAGVQREVIE